MLLKYLRIQAIMVLLGGLLGLLTAPETRAGEATVFAAASLKTALDQVTQDFQEDTGDKITISYGGSSVLARQIELGAPADLYLSASTAWMDYLQQGGHIDAASRVNLLGNRLALIVHGEAAIMLAITPELPLADMLGNGRLAMALVDAVPAGIYGKAALERLGLWDAVAPKVAQTDNVRAALALVATGATPMGVVYATDAAADPRVTAMSLFPEDSHPPIIYPAALTTSGNETAAAFLAYLSSDTAAERFVENGFQVLGGRDD
ncbi:molybdate ABC transporter substrate-binding protein [Actibacterium pelagium]|uniref:Molybdate-binding protein ModA n=1 Tax=Actibacterium pelagium TaxID=2029103 RepID=A0A917AK51_9RHOB|nr:molybdate ABC transporter substrate-binding protein [Actibacterium pelagium]GGE58569.1 molybdate ABC transporter substrate-binding protein [Actibacterium pelagium]